MKRLNNLYEQIISLNNLRLADAIAQQGKSKQYGVMLHNKNAEANILQLHAMLANKTFKTSEYKTFTIREPKERLVYRLPYFPDRIVHHAVMNILEPVFVKMFTSDTYNCIKCKGIHAAVVNLKATLRDTVGTAFCLKLDIQKFYPSIDHTTLKILLRRKFKDADLLELLDGIVDSAPGLPIGNYLSQYLSNFYLCYFDHWLKEQKGVIYYFRYADDMVILADNKDYLHTLFTEIKRYLNGLKLTVKGNYQIFPVDARGIDFLGYRFYHTHILLRKSIKQSFARAVARNAKPQTLASYRGWAKHCNSRNLLKKLHMKQFSEMGIKPAAPALAGEKIKVNKILNKQIIVHSYRIEKSKYPERTKDGNCLYLQIEIDGQKHVCFTGSSVLIEQVQQVNPEDFPFQTTITQENEHFQFN